jgi:hypothetical protein
MSRGIAVTSSSAMLSMALLFSTAILAPNHSRAQTSRRSGCAQMVPAYAALADNLDSSKLKAGDPVRVILSNKVTLKNGTLLPAGTAIVGVVSTDDQQLTGTTKLALRFTKAEIKGGKEVAIKATIVGIFPPKAMISPTVRSSRAISHERQPSSNIPAAWMKLAPCRVLTCTAQSPAATRACWFRLSMT